MNRTGDWFSLIVVLTMIIVGPSYSAGSDGDEAGTGKDTRSKTAANSDGPVFSADDWPRFRGPTGMGVGRAENLPVRWSQDDNVARRTPLAGAGASSPIV